MRMKTFKVLRHGATSNRLMLSLKDKRLNPSDQASFFHERGFFNLFFIIGEMRR
jgi:hypothetical protein